jgi:hypothetical protein
LPHLRCGDRRLATLPEGAIQHLVPGGVAVDEDAVEIEEDGRDGTAECNGSGLN